MLISGGTLVSDCHGAIIYLEGEEYRCMQCMRPCKSAGTLSEKHERDNAIPKEHQRLQSAVVEAAKVETEAYDAPLTPDWCMAHWRTQKAVWSAVKTLVAFEAEHGITNEPK